MQEELVITERFSEVVSKFSSQIALQIEKDNQWQKFTYKDVEIFALRLANFLIKEGLKKNDFVTIILENRPEWAIMYLGIMYAGCTCVPLDYQLSPEEILNLIIDSNTKFLFCSYEIFNKKINKEIRRSLNKIVVVDLGVSCQENCIDFYEIQKASFEESFTVSLEPDDVASLIYTSGTTGIPKGVLLTHKNICSNFISVSKLDLCFSSDNFLSFLPLHHIYSFMVTLIIPLFLGATVTFYPLGFKPQELGKIIKEIEITILVGVPQFFSLLYGTIFARIKMIPFFLRPFLLPFIRLEIKHSLGRSLRLLVSGGAKLEPKIGRGLRRLGFKIVEGYGLTETSPIVTLNPPQRVKFDSVGKPIPAVEIKIHQPDSQGRGQILIKGLNVMKGYFKQSELTSTVIKEEWFYSGDLGYIDKDGYLFITGREKEVIVLSSGKTIYPEELEAYYGQSLYIKEICILDRREESFGHTIESLYAIVIPNLEYFRERNEANIRAKIRWELENLGRKLPSHKHIMGFTLTKEELPRTALRKIKRYQVKEKYLKIKPSKLDIEKTAFTEEDLKILHHDVSKKIIRYISTRIKKPVFLDSHLEIDLGIDSLTRVELGLGLETLFSIKIPDDVLYTVSTVKDVIINILEMMGEPKQTEIYEIKGSEKNWGQILREPPKREILQKIRVETNLLDWLLTGLFKNIFSFIFRVFWFLRIKGKENLPKSGPYIICPNHASYLDGFAVFSSLSFKQAINTFFLGYSAIFEHPLIRWAIKLARLIPIDPNVRLIDAMQAVSFILSHNKIVCIFPEGQRSINERIGEFKKGVGILIKELDIAAIGVYIKGSHHSWPRGNLLPRFYPLKVIFDRPYLGKELIKQKKESISDDYEAITEALREGVMKLIC